MGKIVKRCEVSDEYKWKVEDIYALDELWEADYNSLMAELNEPCEYKGKVGQSAGMLAEVLDKTDRTEQVAEALYVYAYMRYYEDTSNAKYQAMSGKAGQLMVKYSYKYAYLTPEIMAIPDDVMLKYMACDKVAPYRLMLEDMLSKKAHSLSEAEENILAMAGDVTDTAKDVFSSFNNADIKFGEIKAEDGSMTTLTNGRYGVFMESNDRRVRRDAFESLYKGYRSYINTLASTYYGSVKQAIFYARSRKYASTLQKSLDSSFIPVEVYKNLIDTVNSRLNLMHEYVRLRKSALGVRELHFYDVYAPMVKDYKLEIDYSEAKNIVMEALKPMGEDYVSVVRKGFETGWVDVYENEGKRTGAFSWGAYGTHPYVFMNYSGRLNDVFTLAHEMGHAMHTYYSNKSQPHMYAGYRIFVAEVASTCNEALLINYLLKHSTDDMEKKYLLNYYMEQFKSTLFRQTMFAEFEMTTHRLAEEGEVLNADKLCSIYRGLNEKYFGPDMVIDEEIAYEWARIPHFYTPFYVYQYATGFSAAIAIAKEILSGNEDVICGYKRFLSGGSSMHPIELLKLAGVDMSRPQVIESALDVFEDLLKRWQCEV